MKTMRDKLKSNWGVILTSGIFVFGLFFSGLGWFATDKLKSIDNTLSKLEGWIMDTKKENGDQNKDIEALKAGVSKCDGEIKDINAKLEKKGIH